MLDVEIEVGDVRDELRVRLRLIPRAHDPEPDAHAVLLHEPGNDRVERPLSRREHVRVIGVEREQRAAVLKHEAAFPGTDAAAESVVRALDERDDVAVPVDGGKIDRIAAVRGRDAFERRRLDGGGGVRRIDHRRPRSRVLLVDQRRERCRREARIGRVAEHIGIGELLRFDHHVQRSRAVEPIFTQRKLLHDVEHQQRGKALRVRRQLEYLPAVVRRRDRGDPLGSELGEIRGGHRAAVRAQRVDDRAGNRSCVECRSAVGCDRAQRLRERRIREPLARARRAAVDEERRRSAHVAGELVGVGRPSLRDDVGHRKSLFGVEHRRREHVGHSKAPEPRLQRLPSGDASGHGHRIDTRRRHRRQAARSEQRGRETGRRPPARVQSVRPIRLGFVDDREQIAADAVHLGLDDAEHGVGRNRRVGRGAAALEDLHPRARGQRLARSDDAERRGYFRPAGDDGHDFGFRMT